MRPGRSAAYALSKCCLERQTYFKTTLTLAPVGLLAVVAPSYHPWAAAAAWAPGARTSRYSARNRAEEQPASRRESDVGWISFDDRANPLHPSRLGQSEMGEIRGGGGSPEHRRRWRTGRTGRAAAGGGRTLRPASHGRNVGGPVRERGGNVLRDLSGDFFEGVARLPPNASDSDANKVDIWLTNRERG